MTIPPTEVPPSHLYKSLYYKISRDGMQDIYNTSGFVILFVFSLVVLTLILSMFIWWWRENSEINKVGVMAIPPVQEQERSMVVQVPESFMIIQEPERVMVIQESERPPRVSSQTRKPKRPIEVVVLVPECAIGKKYSKKGHEVNQKWYQAKL